MPHVKIKEPSPAFKRAMKLMAAPKIERSIIPIVLRRDAETGKPCLFFMNGNTRGQTWLMGYAHDGQHFEPSWEYYRKRTIAADRDDPEVAALVREWANQPPLDDYSVHTGFPPFGRKLT